MLSLGGDGDVCVIRKTSESAPVPVFPDSEYICDPSTLPPR